MRRHKAFYASPLPLWALDSLSLLPSLSWHWQQILHLFFVGVRGRWPAALTGNWRWILGSRSGGSTQGDPILGGRSGGSTQGDPIHGGCSGGSTQGGCIPVGAGCLPRASGRALQAAVQGEFVLSRHCSRCQLQPQSPGPAHRSLRRRFAFPSRSCSAPFTVAPAGGALGPAWGRGRGLGCGGRGGGGSAPPHAVSPGLCFAVPVLCGPGLGSSGRVPRFQQGQGEAPSTLRTRFSQGFGTAMRFCGELIGWALSLPQRSSMLSSGLRDFWCLLPLDRRPGCPCPQLQHGVVAVLVWVPCEMPALFPNTKSRVLIDSHRRVPGCRFCFSTCWVCFIQ